MKKDGTKLRVMRCFLCVLFLSLIIFILFMPGMILQWQSTLVFQRIQVVSKESYASERTAMARQESSRLRTDEKLSLIGGSKSSEILPAAPDDMELTEFEAVNSARQGISKLFDKDIYPYTLEGTYGNWYSYEAKPHRAVETAFHTYGVGFWEIHFDKYDESLHHIIWMLEDGTIFLAMAYPCQEKDRAIIKKGQKKEKNDTTGNFPYVRICPEGREIQPVRVGEKGSSTGKNADDGQEEMMWCAIDPDRFFLWLYAGY